MNHSLILSLAFNCFLMAFLFLLVDQKFSTSFSNFLTPNPTLPRLLQSIQNQSVKSSSSCSCSGDELLRLPSSSMRSPSPPPQNTIAHSSSNLSATPSCAVCSMQLLVCWRLSCHRLVIFAARSHQADLKLCQS